MQSLLVGSTFLQLFASASLTHAGGPRQHRLSTFEQFDEGEVTGAAIEGTGKVTVGYSFAGAEISGVSTAFSCYAGLKAAWVGTSDHASIYRVRFDSPSSNDNIKPGPAKAQHLAKLPGAVVSAILRLPNGDLIASTLPGGEIHRIRPSGNVSTFAELPVKQIWDIVLYQDRILVATGPNGKLFSLDLQGKTKQIILDVDEADLLDIEIVGSEILVGTAPKARIYRVGNQRKGYLLADFPGDEVRSIRQSGRHLFAAVNKFESRGVSSTQALTKMLNRTSLTGSPPSSSDGSKSEPTSSAALFHVDLGPQTQADRAGEAAWEIWLAKKKQYFTSTLAIDEQGGVLVSSSQSGKIYRVKGRRNISNVADLEQRQATSLCRIGSGPVIATAGDGAAVYRLSNAPQRSVLYTSEVFDSEQPADYGTLSIRGNGNIQAFIRSGPSDTPDKRWSPWRKVALKAQHAQQSGFAKSPRHRYVQLKFRLKEPHAELRDVSLYYVPENLPPVIESIAIRPPEFKREDNTEPDSKTMIKWKVDPQDDDDLVYDLRIRPEGSSDEEWMSLTEDKVTTKEEFGLETATIPDGVYEVRLKASDEPSNGSARAQSDEMISDPFVVDHLRPTIESAKVRGREIKGLVQDQGGQIFDVSYSIDDDDFRSASASDGLFDSAKERFELLLPKLERGFHRVVIRVRDTTGNFSTQALRIRL